MNEDIPNNIPEKYKDESCIVHELDSDGFQDLCGSCVKLAYSKMIGDKRE